MTDVNDKIKWHPDELEVVRAMLKYAGECGLQAEVVLAYVNFRIRGDDPPKAEEEAMACTLNRTCLRCWAKSREKIR